MITVADLKEQTGTAFPRPVLRCNCCGETYSANKGDYFMYPHDHVLTCCDEPMMLVGKKITYEEVKP